MKKFIVLFLLFFSLILSSNNYASDVYYCSDSAITGFDPKENFKLKNYEEGKFKILIDFENKNVFSNDIWMGKNSVIRCVFDNIIETLYCISDFGTAFSINEKNLKFRRGVIYNQVNQGDDITIAYGTCDKF